MRRTGLIALVACLPAALLLPGCANDEMVRARLDVTVGQQLIDLKQAHEAGALSRDEYERQRRRLIDSVR